MGFFNLGKKKAKLEVTWTEAANGKTQKVEVDDDFDDDLFQEDMEHLTPKGELPWGWVYKNKTETDRISSEYSYFLDTTLAAEKSQNPYELKCALHSFIKYIEDCQKWCSSKSECFEYWFMHCVADKKYIEKRKAELAELEEDYDRRLSVNKYMQSIPSFEEAVIETISNNEGILQKDLPSYFMNEPEVQMKVKDALYELTKSGKVEKVKQGRSNMLKLK